MVKCVFVYSFLIGKEYFPSVNSFFRITFLFDTTDGLVTLITIDLLSLLKFYV